MLGILVHASFYREQYGKNNALSNKNLGEEGIQ